MPREVQIIEQIVAAFEVGRRDRLALDDYLDLNHDQYNIGVSEFRQLLALAMIQVAEPEPITTMEDGVARSMQVDCVLEVLNVNTTDGYKDLHGEKLRDVGKLRARGLLERYSAFTPAQCRAILAWLQWVMQIDVIAKDGDARDALSWWEAHCQKLRHE